MKANAVTSSTQKRFGCFSTPTSPGAECWRGHYRPALMHHGSHLPTEPAAGVLSGGWRSPSLATATMLPWSLSDYFALCRVSASESQEGNALGSNFAGSLRTTYGSVFLFLCSKRIFSGFTWMSSDPNEEPGQSLLIKFSFIGPSSPSCKELGAKTAPPQWPDAQFPSQNNGSILKKCKSFCFTVSSLTSSAGV